MGGARNLWSWRGKRKGSRVGNKRQYFLCVGQMSTLLIQLCTWKRCSGIQGQSPWSRVRRAFFKHFLKQDGFFETFLAFGHAIKPQIWPFFNIWKRKKHKYLGFLAKMAFHNSHLGMMKGTYHHQIFFLGTADGGKGEGTGDSGGRGKLSPMARPCSAMSLS